MTLSDIVAIVGLITSLISIVSVVYLGASKIAKLEVKIETVWDFLMKRAFSEGLARGALAMNSPIVVTVLGRQWMLPLTADLRKWFQEQTCVQTDTQLSMAIELKFGERMLKEVCVPNRMSNGECLVVAAIITRELCDPPQSVELGT